MDRVDLEHHLTKAKWEHLTFLLTLPQLPAQCGTKAFTSFVPSGNEAAIIECLLPGHQLKTVNTASLKLLSRLRSFPTVHPGLDIGE